jgi:hypothetical protein
MSAPAVTPDMDLSSGLVGAPAAAPADAPGAPAINTSAGDMDLSAGVVGAPPKPAPASNLSSNELMLTSLGGPWSSDPRLTPEQKGDVESGRAAGAVSVPVVAGSMIGTNEAVGALTAGGKALLPALTSGITAIGAWAEAHPVTAKLIYEGIKGAGWYKLLKTASRVGNAGNE